MRMCSCRRFYVREMPMDNEAEVFLNSVPLLASLTREERTQLVQALDERTYEKDEWVIRQVCSSLPCLVQLKSLYVGHGNGCGCKKSGQASL